MAAGSVLELWRWPVKSMGGERVRALRVDARGVGGDRTHAVEMEHKSAWQPMTAREAPRLLAWRAGYPFAPDATLRPEQPPLATVSGPDGRTWRWGDPRLRLALEADVGRPLRLRRDLDGIQDLAHSVLVTTEATRRALSGELGTDVDVRRFRPNVHLDLDADPWVEEEWTGATLRFADGVVLRLLHPCERCAIPTRDPATQEKWPGLLRHLHSQHAQLFGINARVVRSGRVHEGEPVELEPG